MLAKGVGIRAGRKPMIAYRRHPGESHGHHWYVPSVRGTSEFPHVAVDVNPDLHREKTFVHTGLATAAGERGCGHFRVLEIRKAMGRIVRRRECRVKHVFAGRVSPRSRTSATAPPRGFSVAALREGGSRLGLQNRS